jgi:hypothetical protein
VAEAKKRRLPVLQGSNAGEAPPSRAYVVAVSAAATLLAWLVIAGALNGFAGSAIASAGGDLAVSIANLIGLGLSAIVGGATAAALDASAPLARPRLAGALAALAGWLVPFVWMVGAGQASGANVGTWLVILFVMAGTAALSAEAGFRARRSRKDGPAEHLD